MLARTGPWCCVRPATWMRVVGVLLEDLATGLSDDALRCAGRGDGPDRSGISLAWASDRTGSLRDPEGRRRTRWTRRRRPGRTRLLFGLLAPPFRRRIAAVRLPHRGSGSPPWPRTLVAGLRLPAAAWSCRSRRSRAATADLAGLGDLTARGPRLDAAGLARGRAALRLRRPSAPEPLVLPGRSPARGYPGSLGELT